MKERLSGKHQQSGGALRLVGASLLAMDVNANAFVLNKHRP